MKKEEKKEAKKDEKVEEKKDEKAEAKKDEKSKEAKSKGRYTLQISSFQDRAEAEAFVAKITPNGYKPYTIQSEVPGKGTFFRVRLGEYGSNEEALSAKTAFETSQHIIAYVTKL